MAIGDELSNLDFESMLGGPLIAVVNAQAQAATTTVDFIKSVGFDENGEVRNVTFTYMKPVEETAADGTVTVSEKKATLSVPFLTMLPIPFLRVEETTIDFNAKINSVQEREVASEHGIKADLSVKQKWLMGSAKLKVSYSYKRSTRTGSKTERTYTMAVHIRAVQDEIPEGTARLLGILENAIKEKDAA